MDSSFFSHPDKNNKHTAKPIKIFFFMLYSSSLAVAFIRLFKSILTPSIYRNDLHHYYVALFLKNQVGIHIFLIFIQALIVSSLHHRLLPRLPNLYENDLYPTFRWYSHPTTDKYPVKFHPQE